MTQLKCTVHNCTYQKDDCCCRGNIMVEGKHASTNRETCCGSFEERKGCGCHNATGEAPKMSDISCEVVNCKFNAEGKCDASDIAVTGNQACTCSETECASFVCK